MLSHPGLGFIVGGPGARPSFDELLMYRKPAERGPVVKRNHALCGLAAVCNAVSLLRGTEAAHQVLKSAQRRGLHGCNFSRFSDDIDGIGRRLEMRSVDFAEFANFSRYDRSENHVLVVRTRRNYSLEHVVAVELGRSRIFDSEEPCSLFL